MAKFLFVAVNDINALGIRTLSACLKQEGHDVSVVFMKRPGYPYTSTDDKYFTAAKQLESYDWVGIHHDGTPYRYSRGPEITEIEMELFISTVTDIKPDLIGFTVTVPLIRRVAMITEAVKNRMEVPIFWGGAGTTTDPEECLQYCDFVCIGEGEKTIVEVAKTIDEDNNFKKINGLAYLEKGKYVQNPISSLVTDMDRLPPPDINPQGKYLIEDDQVVDNFREISYSGCYHVMGSRGCPFSCSYCTESYFKKLYSSQRFLRRRSPVSVINEIKQAQQVADFEKVYFEDEVFSLDRKWLTEFKDLYKKEINLPFTCYIYPSRNLDQQLKLLKETGITDTCLSLQSGSQYINDKIFKRVFKKEHYLEIANKLAEMDIPYYTDVITYNPYENEDDLKDTLEILLQIPKPVYLCINKLYVLNKTGIQQLIENGVEKERMNTIPKRLFDYYARLYWFSFEDGNEFVWFCQKVKIFRFFPFLLNSKWVVSKIRNYLQKRGLGILKN